MGVHGTDVPWGSMKLMFHGGPRNSCSLGESTEAMFHGGSTEPMFHGGSTEPMFQWGYKGTDVPWGVQGTVSSSGIRSTLSIFICSSPLAGRVDLMLAGIGLNGSSVTVTARLDRSVIQYN